MKFVINLQRIVFIVITLITLCSVTTVAQEKATYQVKQGDTLYGISKNLNVTIAELKEWNNLIGNEIELGQELVYYLREAELSETELPDEPSEPLVNRSSGGQNTFYTVKSGDTLYRIAGNHNMTINQLKSLNNLSDDNIRVGQKLAVKKVSVAPNVARFLEESTPQGIFSVYKIKSGESVQSILNRFSMTEKEFKMLNPEIEPDNVQSGQEVTILLPPSRKYANPYLQRANLQDLGAVKVVQYSEDETGKTTTNGELYDPGALTAAHSNIALGSLIFVENNETGNGVYVRINDRITGAGMKLSKTAYNTLKLNQLNQPVVTIYSEGNE
ncbi:MAG: LysM peptidoglycan-binding domain-containing protein [Gracilimonas sp.]